MSGPSDLTKIKYYELSTEERLKLLEKLSIRLKGLEGIAFAYVHGSFIEKSFFKDLDVAIRIRDLNEAFYYTVDSSAKMSIELKTPVDVQVLNGAPLPFKYYVFTRGKLLFSRDENLRLKLADESIRQYIDLRLLKEVASKS